MLQGIFQELMVLKYTYLIPFLSGAMIALGFKEKHTREHALLFAEVRHAFIYYCNYVAVCVSLNRKNNTVHPRLSGPRSSGMGNHYSVGKH